MDVSEGDLGKEFRVRVPDGEWAGMAAFCPNQRRPLWPYARLSEGRPRSPDIALGAAQRYVAEAKAARLDLLAAFDLARHRHPPMRDDAPIGRETEWRRWLI
jgi:hypothetical protein